MADMAEEKNNLDVCGLQVTCASDEALELFNSACFSYITVRQRCTAELSRALQLDDSMVMGHCLLAYLHLGDLKGPNDVKVAPHLAAIKTAKPGGLTHRETFYIRAVQSYASGSLLQAAVDLEEALLYYPTDALALRIVTGAYIVLAEFERQRNAIARALAHWNKDMKLYPFVLAFYAYSLEECNQRNRAEAAAKTALAMDKSVPIATHALSHVIEEEREPMSGVELLTSTRDDWSTSVYGGHITWHLALYYLDLGDFDSMFREFDSAILKRVASDDILSLLDAASLLWRLNVMGVDPGDDRWSRVTEACVTHIGNHRSPWFDAHIMMSLARGKVSESAARLALASAMLRSLESAIQDDLVDSPVRNKLSVPVCTALLAFGKERYSEVLSLLLPLRFDLRRLGGSWAQRQVFSTTIIQAAIHAGDLHLAMDLVAELKALKPHSKCLEALFNDLKLNSTTKNRKKQTL